MRLTFLTKANVVKFVGEELLCNIYIPFKKMFVQDMYFQKARLTVVFKVNFVDKLQSYIPKASPNA